MADSSDLPSTEPPNGRSGLDVGARATAIENVFRNSGQKFDNFDIGAARQAAIQLVWLCLPPPPPTRLTRKVGRVEARKELDDLTSLSEKLINRFWTLSATAINALGGSHIVVASKPQMQWLGELVEVAREAKIVDARDRGSSKNRRENCAARIVIDFFEKTTGCAVDRSSKDKPRGLEPLVRKIFAKLDIEGNAKAAIAAALREREQQTSTPALGKDLMPPSSSKSDCSTSASELFERMRRAEIANRSPRHWKAE